ncbi:Oxygen-insensitive NAD(P)H nitroreductase [Tenacibaculum sp. 190130A14a]|uniref:Nitroreductase / dihydropteridine reductase n=1 Tax=Tenacibaculum polynesiense TaxID=3137857 RepID=A0ABM9P7E9_9FLAO
MSLIENLNWRYATKKFDSSKKITITDLNHIESAIQLSASSYGLQLYKVFIIEDIDLRSKLKAVSWNQSQITEASHLFVFCNYINNITTEVDNHIKLTAKTRNLDEEMLNEYGSFILEKIFAKSEIERCNWTRNQTYIALANLLSICAELKIDACPMEGFDSVRYNEILGLNQIGLNACVLAAVGYRDKEDKTQYLEKVRKSKDVLFEYL